MNALHELSIKLGLLKTKEESKKTKKKGGKK